MKQELHDDDKEVEMEMEVNGSRVTLRVQFELYEDLVSKFARVWDILLLIECLERNQALKSLKIN